MTDSSGTVPAVRLFGLDIVDVTLQEAAVVAVQHAQGGQLHDVCFVNAHCVNVAVDSAPYRAALHRAHRLYADGSGMRLAAGWAGTRLRDNVNGTDLFPCICAEAARRGVPIALLGARPGVAERCAAAMTRRFPTLKVVWVHHGYLADCDVPSMLASLADSGARVLFVAMGVPAQELWLAQHRTNIAPPATLAVGALFDFYSGDIPRAPLALRKLGLEWLFRLALEPRRLFARYVLGNPRFLVRALWLAARGRLRHAPLGRDS